MKIKEGLKISNVAGENFIVATGDMRDSFKDTIVLNDTACFIFGKLKESISFEELVKAITDEYEIDASTASLDAEKIIDFFKNHNIIED